MKSFLSVNSCLLVSATAPPQTLQFYQSNLLNYFHVELISDVKIMYSQQTISVENSRCPHNSVYAQTKYVRA